MEIVCTMLVSELLEIVKKNREQHIAMREDALQGYCDDAIKRCTSAVEELKAGKAVNVHIVLQPPADHTKDYDRVIDMLARTTATEIGLDETNFARLINDDWEWVHTWVHANRRYSKRLDDYGTGKGF